MTSLMTSQNRAEVNKEYLLLQTGNGSRQRISKTKWRNRTGPGRRWSSTATIPLLARIQLVAPWFVQSFWLTTYRPTHTAVWLPKYCNQCV